MRLGVINEFGGRLVKPNEESGEVLRRIGCPITRGNKDRTLKLKPGLSGNQKPRVERVYYSD